MAVSRVRPSVRSTPSLLALSWTTFAGVTVLFGLASLSGVTVSLRHRSLLYLALMVGVSLPHGGFEHVENLKGRGERFQVEYLAAYLLSTAAVLAVFFLAPLVGLAIALAIMGLKAGNGGLRVLESVHGAAHLRTRPQRALAVLVRGGTVLAVPLVAHPGIYHMVAGYMVGLFGRSSTAVAWLFTDAALLAVGAVYGAALAAHLALGYARASERVRWGVEASETLLLVSFFLVVPPIVAIGVYFPLWYATRQTARYAGDDSLAALGRRVVRGGALPWLGSVAILGGAWFLLPNPPTTPSGWVAYYSVFVSVIAVPHVAVGEWLDRKQGIWAT